MSDSLPETLVFLKCNSDIGYEHDRLTLIIELTDSFEETLTTSVVKDESLVSIKIAVFAVSFCKVEVK